MYKSVFQLSRVQTVQTRSDTFRRVQTGLNAVQTRSDWSERPPLFAVWTYLIHQHHNNANVIISLIAVPVRFAFIFKLKS